eukprot:TRINITY_DN64178_c0_g1_i1.p1 TRINITY_DN64178_c0_g1~~TRINITY_DN64178_c0_g1_i1.p1  ORF type:complete len:299 (+),score=66.24 TRINITY_DN64178_c0_g1_i1:82-978(+)
MVLPPELQIYAENILRRFPEEFMALGAPGLEDIYDLRPNGTWSRRMMESATEKTVEITIRRWHVPSLMPPQAMGGYMPQAQSYFQVGAASTAASAAAAAVRYPAAASAGLMSPPVSSLPAADPQVDDQSMQRLARLENALLALKPQIEAVVASQSKAQHTAHLGGNPGNNSGPRLSGYAADESAAGNPGDMKGAASATPEHGGGQELRSRRHMDKLQIITSPKEKAKAQAQKPQPMQPVQVQTQNHQAEVSSDELAKGNVGGKAGEKARPRVISTVRVAPCAMDPKSPRSPGRYTAWG